MLDDEKIIELFFKRDEAAIKEAEEKYGERLLLFSERITGDREVARECANDVYLALWNNIPPESPEPLYTYILKLARNISISRYRAALAAKRGTHKIVPLEELEAVLASYESPIEELLASELRDNIEAFLREQTQENRVIFVRRYFYLDTYQDIASITELPEKTVSVRLVRLRERLRKYLIKKGAIYE